MSQTRRLAAILAADVVGYSRLIGADEEGTLERLKALRRDVIDPRISHHHGRVVKTTGDGLLVEFSSVVDALRCATEVQKMMAERNLNVPPETRIEFRAGIHQAILSSMMAIFLATGLMLPLAWKHWPIQAVSAFRPVCRRTQRVSLTLRSRIWASRASKTLPAL